MAIVHQLKYKWFPYNNGAVRQNIGSIFLSRDGKKLGKAVAAFVNRANGEKIADFLTEEMNGVK